MENPLDKRQKLIPVSAIGAMTGEEPEDRVFPWPESIGMIDDLGVTSDEVDAWLEANWRPC
jgi:hypothetical protein